MLLYGVQLVGGRVTSLPRQLSLGVVARAGTWDIDVAATEVATALQGWRRRSVSAVDNDARREKILVLQGQFVKMCHKNFQHLKKKISTNELIKKNKTG